MLQTAQSRISIQTYNYSVFVTTYVETVHLFLTVTGHFSTQASPIPFHTVYHQMFIDKLTSTTRLVVGITYDFFKLHNICSFNSYQQIIQLVSKKFSLHILFYLNLIQILTNTQGTLIEIVVLPNLVHNAVRSSACCWWVERY